MLENLMMICSNKLIMDFVVQKCKKNLRNNNEKKYLKDYENAIIFQNIIFEIMIVGT